MAYFQDFRETNKKFDADSIHINTKKKRVTGHVNVLKFIDRDTLQTVCYVPSLEITGYGENQEKATEMTRQSIADFFDYISSIPSKKREMELFALGWKVDALKNKDFSNAYIDVEGQLQSFNAVENKVDRITIEA